MYYKIIENYFSDYEAVVKAQLQADETVKNEGNHLNKRMIVK